MKYKIPTWVIVVIVILVIVIFILSVGLLSPDLGSKKAQEETEEEKERKRREAQQKALNDLKNELEKTNKEIAETEAKLISIGRQEKWVMFGARVVIALILAAADIFYFRSHGWSENDWIGDLLKFNSFLIACYSFIAFISHGTPAKFAAFLKSGIRVFLRWYHKSVYQNYEVQKFNRELLATLILATEIPATVKTKETAPDVEMTSVNT